MRTVGLIGAMDEEVSILKDYIRNPEEVNVAGSTFIRGIINNEHVVLLKSGIGKVNAAMGATLLNHLYHPNYVINTGSAGGLDVALSVGDVVISSAVCHHDVDVTAFGYAYGQVPQLPTFYLPDDHLYQLAVASAQNIEGVQALPGLIASGDSFMNDLQRIAFIRSKLPELVAVEMEAAAIAQVCFHFKTPFVVIRALSDIAGKESQISFQRFLETAAMHSARVVLGILENLGE